MQKCFCLGVIGFWCFLQVSAQKPPLTWGKVSDEEQAFGMDQLRAPAGAVILYDYGLWRMTGDQEHMALDRHIRLKILDSTGLGYAKCLVEFQTSDGLEDIKDLRAQTLNFVQGKKSSSKLALKYLPAVSIGEGKVKKEFVFRDVVPGSIIEYAYTLITKDQFSLRPWYFQHEIPILHSEVRMMGLADVYRPIAFGSRAPQQKWQGEYIKRWFLKNLPPWQAEAYTAFPAEGRMGMHLQFDAPREAYGLTGFEPNWAERWERARWQAFSSQLESITPFRANDEHAAAFGALVAALTREALTDEEKMARIYDHIRDHMRWNQRRDLYVQRTADEIYRSRTGHASEINLLLTVLLQTAGLEAYKCFVATRDYGRIQLNFPLLAQFNHLITYVKLGRQRFFLDATEPLRPYDLPALASINAAGWVLETDTAYWQPLPTGFKAERRVTVTLDLSQEGARAHITEQYTHHRALQLRQQLQQRGEVALWQTHRNLIQSDLIPDSLIGAQQIGGTLELDYTIGLDPHAEVQGDTLLLYPLLAFGQQENPFSGPRQLPIDFGTHQVMIYKARILPPPGYRLDTLPEGIRNIFPKDPLQMSYQIFQTPTGSLQVELSWLIRRAVFLPSEKMDLSTFFSRLIKISQQPIRWIRT